MVCTQFQVIPPTPSDTIIATGNGAIYDSGVATLSTSVHYSALIPRVRSRPKARLEQVWNSTKRSLGTTAP